MKQEIDIMAKFASRIMAMGTITVVIALLLSAVLSSCSAQCIDENAINYGSDTTCVYSQEYVQFLLDEIEWWEFSAENTLDYALVMEQLVQQYLEEIADLQYANAQLGWDLAECLGNTTGISEMTNNVVGIIGHYNTMGQVIDPNRYTGVIIRKHTDGTFSKYTSN